MRAIFERGLENYGRGGSRCSFPELHAGVEAIGQASRRSWKALSGSATVASIFRLDQRQERGAQLCGAQLSCSVLPRV